MSEVGTKVNTKQPSSLSIANLCCLFGTGLVIYGAFLLQPALGYLSSGVFCVAYGVYRERTGGKT